VRQYCMMLRIGSANSGARTSADARAMTAQDQFQPDSIYPSNQPPFLF
jgi:hypothetical protein